MPLAFEGSNFEPFWSPDGRSILVRGFMEYQSKRDYGLHLVDVETGDFSAIV